MFEIVAFNVVQATASSESEAEEKRQKLQQHILDHYRGPDSCRVTVRKVGLT